MYKTLPPSLERRLAYSRELRYRNRRNRESISTQPTQNNIEISWRHIVDEYSLFSSLENVEIGLISKNLVKNSEIFNSLLPQNNICVICQYPVSKEIVRKLTTCSHLFHIKCIDTWLTTSKVCPICMKEY